MNSTVCTDEGGGGGDDEEDPCPAEGEACFADDTCMSVLAGIGFPQCLSPYVQRLLAGLADDSNVRWKPFCAFLTAHFDFVANSKVCMVGAFALGIHANANDLLCYCVRENGSSQEAQPELLNDDLEARAGTKGP